MKKSLLVLPAVVVLAGGALAWFLLRPEPPVPWKTTPVQRRDLEQVVTATGSLEAVVSVEVGTQVSGIVSEILVDFNDRVDAGQVVARIDRALLEADVRTAEAGLAQARAEADRADLALRRIRALHERQAATDEELETAVAEADVALATRTTREVALERARRNLGYATITSPITGTVVSRAVDVGQTVNAGLQAPTLFVIAQDLARMQILASVDEADIGEVAAGQDARFTVQAYGDTAFAGRVRQVRLEPSVAENVVTYKAVVDVENADGRLLPGMTATVDVVTARAEGVLCVPPAALRFQPAEGSVPGAIPGAGPTSAGPTGAAPTSAGPPGGARNGGGRAGRPGTRVWVPDGEGLRPIPVETGLVGDGCTQVTGEGLSEGLEVVTGGGPAAAPAAGAGSSSPFQSSGGGGQRMGPPGRL